jgi:hypothetical protein
MFGGLAGGDEAGVANGIIIDILDDLLAFGFFSISSKTFSSQSTWLSVGELITSNLEQPAYTATHSVIKSQPGALARLTDDGVAQRRLLMRNFVEDIIAVLLGKKTARMGKMLWSSEHVFRIRASVRHKQASWFVVLAMCDRRCVTPKCDEAQGCLVAGLDFERPNAV